jgi:glycosyltransferase involved in cell wall biosynthesis
MTGDKSGDAALDSLLLAHDGQSPASSRERLIEVVVPVYNEEKVLERSIRRLHSYLTSNLPFRFVITIADNASTDRTFVLAQRLDAEFPQVRAVHLDRKGRGHALRQV